MLKVVAEGVLVHESEWLQSNGIVVHAPDGVLLVDPGIIEAELTRLADDLGRPVVAGFATHPHWDHLLWHPRFGDVPRYGTAVAATTARDRLSGGVEAAVKAAGAPDGVPIALLGEIIGLPAGATEVPWSGPRIRIIEHRAHAPGHAALLIEEKRVFVAGDMLSDVFIPMLNLMGAADPIDDYLAALALFDEIADEVDVVIPGHGSVGDSTQLRARIDQDRAYVEAVRDGRAVIDGRVNAPAAGWEFVRDVHERQVQRLSH
jgi:glyoxylase-like metal-dependent hydrolase (beta-lactamase superfamily II)